MEEANYTFEELIRNDSFFRWARGKAIPEEKQYWDRWIQYDEKNRLLAKRAQKHVAGFSVRPSARPNRQEAWQRLEQKLDTPCQVSTETGNRKMAWVFRIAAGLLLAAITGWALYSSGGGDVETPSKKQLAVQKVVTDYGERKTIRLADGTEIILNAHSRLLYHPNATRADTGQVFLDGEAYFAVAKRDSSKDTPFRVRTSEGIVRVMGTRFVVSTRDRGTQVVLEEGRVALKALSGPKGDEVMMKPGQLAELHPGRSPITLKSVNPRVYSSWTTYRLVFDNTPLSAVVKRLENTFDVNVIVRNQQLYQRRISGGIDNSNLEVITSALSNTLNTPIKITGKTVYIGK